MNKAFFFDRDGVINSDHGHYYIYRKEDFRINEGVINLMKTLSDLGYLIVIISNQGGIAKGEYSVHDTETLHQFLKDEMQKEGIRIAEIYFCPHHHSIGKCLCRKPDSLLIEKAISRFQINVQQSFFVGDSQRDMDAAAKAGIIGIRVPANADIFKEVSIFFEQHKLAILL